MNAIAPSLVPPKVFAARDFTRHLADLLRKEHGAMVNFLLALAEFDGRRLWIELGYASLFDYLHRELELSKSSAWYRSAGATLVLKYPAIAEALADGRLCVSVLADIRKVITPENVSEILPQFFHRSAREAKEVAAAIAPDTAPPRRDVITTVRVFPAVQPSRSAATSVQTSEPERPVPERPPAPLSTRPPVEVQPLTATLRRIHFTVSKGWMEKLDAAKAALSHSIPSGSAEEVIEAALDALLEREAKRKGLVKNPRKAPAAKSVPVPTPKQRRAAIPAHVRREVLRRDHGCCQAKLHDGSICGSKVRLQFDHVQPDALGGPTTVENVRVLCALHNQLAARRVFGEAIVDLFARGRGP